MKTFLLIFFALVLPICGQLPDGYECTKSSKANVKEFFEKKEYFEKVQLDCRNEYIANESLWSYDFAYSNCHYGNNGCPRSLVYPQISESMRRFQLFGQVDVDAIVDEFGNVIYAKALSGHPLLRQSAENAACKSLFSSKSFCGTPVMEQRFFRYFFNLP